MAFCSSSDIFTWLQNLPPVTQWKTNSMSMCICRTSPLPSLNLSVVINDQSQTLTFFIIANLNMPIILWSSKPFKVSTKSSNLLDEQTISNLLINLIEVILCYDSNKSNQSFVKISTSYFISTIKDIFNFVFLTLAFLICIYEAPTNLRSSCLNILKNNLITCRMREASKSLMKLLGSNLEEQWMRSLNLAITNWIIELQATHHSLKTPSPLFSYAISTYGLWKVQLYCPLIAMDIEHSSNPLSDEKLQFSLNYHQLEGVIQFNYRVILQEKYINLMVNTDNIRYNIVRIINEKLMVEQGVGAEEKHFPSRIFLQLTPTIQTNILSVSVSKSSNNPQREIEIEKNLEAAFDPPNTFLGLKAAVAETTTTSLKPWKFEQSVIGYSVNLNWFLHDSIDGREVFSSKPSKISLLNPRAWFKDRYSSAYRPFTRHGGVIFAGDEYGQHVNWKIDKSAIGSTMEWEIRGWIWVTYWPNKYRTFYNETRKLEFRELLNVEIV